MTADALKSLSLDELYELLVLIMEDYKVLQKSIHNSDAAEIKRAEIRLIQNAIEERKGKLTGTL